MNKRPMEEQGDDIEECIYNKPKRHKPRIKFENAPHVSSIAELITLGKTGKFYRNFDTVMLWRILPNLEELDRMIGLKPLKDSIFYQIIYYLQGMHLHNPEGEYLHTVISGPPGCGKCLGLDTPVMMADGHIKKVQDISVGDCVMGPYAESKRVISVCSGQEEMYCVKQSYGDDFTVNKSHILTLKLCTNPIVFENCTRKEYFLKWVDKDGMHCNVFKYTDEITREAIHENIMLNLHKYPRKGHIIDISVEEYLTRSNQWRKSFKGFKMAVEYPEKSVCLSPHEFWSQKYIEFIPDEYKYNSMRVRASLLYEKMSSIETIDFDPLCVSTQCIHDVMHIAMSIGWKVRLCGNTIHLFRSSNNTYTIKLQSCGIGTYYGFELDQCGRFLLGDFTVTHNTQIANIIGNTYKALGILSLEGEFKVAHRDDLIAEYLGQTAVKTRKLLKSCQGGVLFIDEVYSLGHSEGRDSYSKEAIDTLTAFLSENKNNFCCIVAGYEEDINSCFFSVNKGLDRRFPWRHHIVSYTSTELTEILLTKVHDMKWIIDVDKDEIKQIIETNKDMFKNSGGDIETLLSKCKMTHAKRVFSESNDKKFILTLQDLKDGLEMMKLHKGTQKTDDVPFGMYI